MDVIKSEVMSDESDVDAVQDLGRRLDDWLYSLDNIIKCRQFSHIIKKTNKYNYYCSFFDYYILYSFL